MLLGAARAFALWARLPRDPEQRRWAFAELQLTRKPRPLMTHEIDDFEISLLRPTVHDDPRTAPTPIFPKRGSGR